MLAFVNAETVTTRLFFALLALFIHATPTSFFRAYETYKSTIVAKPTLSFTEVCRWTARFTEHTIANTASFDRFSYLASDLLTKFAKFNSSYFFSICICSPIIRKISILLTN